ncbi:SGNH/GDSL hydrolase family protein [Salinarimonas soli]|uniref:SGNH/GDSL hydrolase family protein n=1 Tax=Salinarimonas soli TaxID=1638099 RepID=UPI001F0A8F5D|nr:SGNH/GDSL hydrolase family protein [Salinarimonas soli]
MALALATAIVAAGVAGAKPALAQTAAPLQDGAREAATAAPAVPAPEAPDAGLSPECRVPGAKLYNLAPLRAVKAALRDDRAIRVLLIGASGGGGAFSSVISYPVRLRTELEKQFKGMEVEVIHRALSGEVGTGAADMVRTATAEIGPDLVIWQVGTNDALARVDVDEFAEALGETVAWLKSHEIDVLLVDPQYTSTLGSDPYYARVVQAVGTAAARNGVPLVQRFEAMKYLATSGGGAAVGGFALNNLGKRCIAEHVARAVAVAVGLAGDETPPASR